MLRLRNRATQLFDFVSLGVLYTLGRFSAIFYNGDKICDFLFAFLHTSPFSDKGVYSKRKDEQSPCF